MTSVWLYYKLDKYSCSYSFSGRSLFYVNILLDFLAFFLRLHINWTIDTKSRPSIITTLKKTDRFAENLSMYL